MDIVTPNDLASIKRSVDGGTEKQRETVKEIIADVQSKQDEALFHYTNKLDGASLSQLRVTEEEFNQAREALDTKDIDILKEAAENIKSFHEKQIRQSWFDTNEDGTVLGQKVTPLDAVGVYVPGGTAAYPSSVFMNVLPAVVAGVDRIVMVSPPSEEGTLPAGVLVAAEIAGVKEVYKVGGAQAVAALAYGTESIQPVDKIVGPGNIYVALAKREVFGDVDIDMIAGPSEIVVLADETAKPGEVAADLLSQAEHDERSSSVLVTTSESLAKAVAEEVDQQLEQLPRKDIAGASIRDFGAIVLCNSQEGAIDVVNSIAPEHLEIMMEEPFGVLGSIKHAGAIFLGRYSSEPVGDYFAGPNHVLPTSGTARFSSPLNVDDFVKKSSVIYYSKQAYEQNADKIARFARLEGLEAHAKAIEKRKDDES
ncbi:histidinol dehydrogenase [Pontibacillus yanchengensis]|uniref:Histidinol dehydrogenase n=1 Tax=Pontibacillus yanchengensis Y32 TaxID=1385514 RepID=A0A0A2TES1_9BACI|nr:histidinol dehydrogenase [Pontibacillus yanchengensis]KGP72898.1 histidinol dehydrogenase [Pontibacillus yanchengensis Y32]